MEALKLFRWETNLWLKSCTFFFLSILSASNSFIRVATVLWIPNLLLNNISKVSHFVIEFSYNPKYHDASLALKVCGNSMDTSSSCSIAKIFKAKEKLCKWSSIEMPFPWVKFRQWLINILKKSKQWRSHIEWCSSSPS